MNTIDSSVELEKYSQETIESVLKEIADVEATIYILLENIIDIQQIFSDLNILYIDYIIPLVISGEKIDSLSGDNITNIIPVNLYFEDNIIENIFEQFNDQISSIYTHTFLDTSSIKSEHIDKTIALTRLETGTNIALETSKILDTSKISTLENALIINELETICDNIHRFDAKNIYVSQIQDIGIDTIDKYIGTIDNIGRIDSRKENIEDLHYTQNFSDKISRNMLEILEANKVTDTIFKSTSTISEKGESEKGESEKGESEKGEFNISVIENIVDTKFRDNKHFSETIDTISELHKVISDFYISNFNVSDIIQSEEQRYPESLRLPKSAGKIIEIPAFRPYDISVMPQEDITINSDIVTKKHNERETEKDITSSKNTVSSKELNMLNTISDCIQNVHNVNNQMSEFVRQNDNIIPLDLEVIYDNENVHSLDIISLRDKYIIGDMTNIIKNTTTDELHNVGFSLIKDITRASPIESHHREFPIININMKEYLSQTFSNQPKDIVTIPGISSINIHNTFNITVNGRDESELKELGRKIGQILSDEFNRYG